MGPYDNLIASYGGKPNGRPNGAVDSFQRQRILPPQVPQAGTEPGMGGQINAGGNPALPPPPLSQVKRPLIQSPGMNIPGLSAPLTVPPIRPMVQPAPMGQVYGVGSIPGVMPPGGGVNPPPQMIPGVQRPQPRTVPGMSPRYNTLAQRY